MSTRPGIRRRLTSRACPERAQRVEGRDVRVVEGARLESVCRGNSTVGSNPTLSAKLKNYLKNLLILTVNPTFTPAFDPVLRVKRQGLSNRRLLIPQHLPQA